MMCVAQVYTSVVNDIMYDRLVYTVYTSVVEWTLYTFRVYNDVVYSLELIAWVYTCTFGKLVNVIWV